MPGGQALIEKIGDVADDQGPDVFEDVLTGQVQQQAPQGECRADPGQQFIQGLGRFPAYCQMRAAVAIGVQGDSAQHGFGLFR